MAFITLNRLCCLLALVMTLQCFVPSNSTISCPSEFHCYCCAGSAGPLPALSQEEEQARATAHNIIVNFTRSMSVVSSFFYF